ncbi:MAG: hypothetical protein JSS02_20640, partial [Planctomycetes bacterium]|nr:hypothetical protein [Planctomycetota bacterium]
QVRDGDLYISGKIQTKDYATQRGIRIPVYNHDYRPADDDPEWRPRWKIGRRGSAWRAVGSHFRFTGSQNSASEDFEWVYYRHWIREGGQQVTSRPLPDWTPELQKLAGRSAALSYDQSRQRLVCCGTMSLETRDRLLANTDAPTSRRAIQQLYEASHVGPIVDNYGYNKGQDGRGQHEVRDLMLSVEVLPPENAGEFAISMTDGSAEFLVVLDFEKRQVRLVSARTQHELRSASLGPYKAGQPILVEVSLMDRQVLVALNGQLPFDPMRYPVRADRGPTPRVPVRFGARGGALEVRSLQLFRDVYYTQSTGQRGCTVPVTLRANEYFVLGDNSPVSHDSRYWGEDLELTQDLLLGKPLVVHLPSRKKRIQIGSWETEIRIPEPSRIRYIH